MTDDEITIKIKKLQDISIYYEFPLAVFFTDDKFKLEGTRKDNLIKHIREATRKIKEIADEL